MHERPERIINQRVICVGASRSLLPPHNKGKKATQLVNNKSEVHEGGKVVRHVSLQLRP